MRLTAAGTASPPARATRLTRRQVTSAFAARRTPKAIYLEAGGEAESLSLGLGFL
jgi:hypothetical protein